MGIKDLSNWIRKVAPRAITTTSLKTFSGHRVAVDASVYLYKYIAVTNRTGGNWLDVMICFILWLRHYNIRPIFIFDGPAPVEKDVTKQARQAARQKNLDLLQELQIVIDGLDEIDINDDLPTDLAEKIIELLKDPDIIHISRRELYRMLNERYRKIHANCPQITGQDKKMQQLLNYLGIPWYKATGEAEKSCSWLCLNGHVSAVITSDTDVLVYGCPIYIPTVTFGQDECTVVSSSQVLAESGMTREQFIDFCILCGTDYNERIPGVGPAKAQKYIEECGNLEEISNVLDTDSLNYRRVRELFTLDDSLAEKLLQDYSGKIKNLHGVNENKLSVFLFKNNSKMTIEEIYHYLYRPKFTVKE